MITDDGSVQHNQWWISVIKQTVRLELSHPQPSWFPNEASRCRFHWLKGSNRQSNSTVEWHIPPAAPSGSYRIRHFGHYMLRRFPQPIINPYEGVSDVFEVAASYYYQWHHSAINTNFIASPGGLSRTLQDSLMTWSSHTNKHNKLLKCQINELVRPTHLDQYLVLYVSSMAGRHWAAQTCI